MELIDVHEGSLGDRSARHAALLYLVWGVAWLLGYGALAGAFTGDWLPISEGAAKAVFTVGILVGVVASIVFGIKEGTSVRGRSARSGAIYGTAWVASFTGYGFLSARLADFVGSDAALFMVQSGVALIIIGALYISGAAQFEDRVMLGLGVWIVVANSVGLVLGATGYFGLMSLLGGGGFIIAGLVSLALVARRRRPVHPSRR